MIKYNLFIFSWVLPFFAICQSYEVQYALPQSFSKSGETDFSRFATLKISQHKSLFVLHGTAGFDAADEERQEITMVTAEPDRWYFSDRSKGLLNSFEQTMIGNTFQISEDIPKLEWNITEVEKLIGGFLCKLANTTFRGREYEAWYAVNLPLPMGPWKLNGLPGLILEANDKEQEVVFQFYSFQILLDPSIRIDAPPCEARKVPFPVFFESQYKDGEKFYQFISDKLKRSLEKSGNMNVDLKQSGEPRFWERKIH
ncbi:MAG: GLPGLI family protein [Bacteroidetes bacterium]|nr:GLPGLI family protein [Bacteroidota bacterium]